MTRQEMIDWLVTTTNKRREDRGWRGRVLADVYESSLTDEQLAEEVQACKALLQAEKDGTLNEELRRQGIIVLERPHR